MRFGVKGASLYLKHRRPAVLYLFNNRISKRTCSLGRQRGFAQYLGHTHFMAEIVLSKDDFHYVLGFEFHSLTLLGTLFDRGPGIKRWPCSEFRGHLRVIVGTVEGTLTQAELANEFISVQESDLL